MHSNQRISFLDRAKMLLSSRLKGALYASLTLLVIVAGCVQHTFDPTQTNAHIVRIVTVKPTGTPEPDVLLNLYDNNSVGAPLDFTGNTGDSGYVDIHLNIPTFGHSYSLNVQKNDAVGQLIYARTIWPLTLSCVDTTIVIVIPDADTSHPTDALCGGQNVARTLTFYSCPDTSVTQNYVLTNCSNAAYTVTASNLAAPFSISPTAATLQAGASEAFTITYDGRGQTSDANTQVTLTTAPASGNATLTLIGHLLHDCNAPTQTIQCGTNSTSDSVRFGTVCQNQTTGTQCITFVNSNNAAVTVTFPAAPAPFSYTVSDNNGGAVNMANPYTLQHGASLTLCFSINPPTLGAVSGTLVLPMQCVNGAKFTYTIPLSATVKLCNNCTCTEYFHDPVTVSNNIPVGHDTTFTAQIFQNTLNCAVTVSNLVSQTGTAWTVNSTSPALPALVAPGGTINANVTFAPTKAGVQTDNITYNITISGSATGPCTGNVTLTATGCNSACAQVVMPPEWRPSPAPAGPDTLFFKQDGNPEILVSSPNGNSVSDQECITISYPDTACASDQITIISPKSGKWTVNSTPSPLTLSPGGTGQICLTFTAPTIAQVRKDFTQPNEELKYTDVLQIVDANGCTKVVPLKAVVDTLPECKEFDLAQYGFVGAGQVVYDESYLFDNGRQDNVPQGAAGVPSVGDIYLKVQGTFSNTTGNLPPGFFHWQNSQTPICDNIQSVVTQLTALGPTNQTYSTTLNFAQYDWIVVEVHPGTYAVIQVTAMYTDGFNIPHAVCSVLYPFNF